MLCRFVRDLNCFISYNLTNDIYQYSGKGKGMDMTQTQCYSCNCGQKFCNYCKQGHIVKECSTRLQNRKVNAFQAGINSFTIENSSSGQVLTPEMDQMSGTIIARGLKLDDCFLYTFSLLVFYHLLVLLHLVRLRNLMAKQGKSEPGFGKNYDVETSLE